MNRPSYILFILAYVLLAGCVDPPRERLDKRFRFKDQTFTFPSTTRLDTGSVYVCTYGLDPDSTQTGYEFYRFNQRGQVWRSQALPPDQLSAQINNYDQGQWGYYQISGDTILIELWLNRYENFAYFDGYFTADQLILTHTHPRGFWKAKEALRMEYDRQSFSDLKPLPDR